MKRQLFRLKEKPKEDTVTAVETAARKLNLFYNFEAVKYILDIEQISIGQLRCAQFFNGHEYYTDYNRAAYYLVLAGLIGSKQESKTDTEALEQHTYKILDNWQKKYDLCLLYLQLIKQLEERHFFADSATLTVMEQMSSMNTYTGFRNTIAEVIALEITELKQVSNIFYLLMSQQSS